MTATIEAPAHEQIDQRTEIQKQVDADTLEAVKNGIEFLNERFGGTSWVDKIDMNVLNLGHGSCFVLGQLYADKAQTSTVFSDCGYAWAARNILGGDEGIELGFCLSRDVRFNHGADQAGAKLTDAWRYALTPFVKETA